MYPVPSPDYVQLVGTREGGKGTIPLADSYGFVEKLRMQSIDHAFALSAAAVDMGALLPRDIGCTSSLSPMLPGYPYIPYCIP